jgi:hypothetical protein
LGKGTVEFGRDALSLVNFLGLLVATTGHVLLRPWRMRWTSLVCITWSRWASKPCPSSA